MNPDQFKPAECETEAALNTQGNFFRTHYPNEKYNYSDPFDATRNPYLSLLQ